MKRVGALVALFFPLVLFAQGTNDLLIEKLNQVNLNLPAKDPSKVSVMLRLADLLAERARQAAIKDLESGCTDCTAGQADRQKALRLYDEALPQASHEQKARVLIQMGHLRQLLGEEMKALSHYQAVLSVTKQGSVQAEAHLAIAEIELKKNNYARAQENYQKVLDEKAASSRGLAAYRVAWCDFNLAQFPAAIAGIKLILRTPELQSRSGGAATTQADVSFLEEVARDLATFMSRQPFVVSEMEDLYKLSPETTRVANVVLLANELERTGKKADAAQAWGFAFERMSQPALKLEALVHLVPLRFNEANTTESLKTLDQAVALWLEMKSCGSNNCDELQKILRQFIVNWNQTEKKAPSDNLQNAYQRYLALFADDHQMQLWAAQVAETRKDWSAASLFYHGAFASLAKAGKKPELEKALLAHLEMAELSKSEDLWHQAADAYLAQSSEKTKAFEVRYQKTQKIYDKGDYQTASTALRELALTPKAPQQLRVQAAHLSLDAVSFLKDEARLVTWAKEYAQQFPTAAKEFKEINQKAILSESARLAEKDSEAAWVALAKFDSQNASLSDRKIYLKNKIILSEKTQRFPVAAQAVEEYLLLPNLNAEEKEFALAKKTWLAELRLDFSTALKSFEKMSANQLKPEQKFLKLALYADLAGVNSTAYYHKFMTSTSDQDLRTGMAAELVRKSPQPQKELSKQAHLLKTKPELLGRLYAEIYVKSPDEKFLKNILQEKTIENTSWGKTFWRISYLEQLKALHQKVQSGKIDSSTQKAMNRTIKSRAADLAAFEKVTAQAIQKTDWSAQVVSLTWLGQESQRFYEELMSLPLPAGLTPEEESQYMTLLSQQSAPYKNKAEEAKSKVSEFWTSSWQEPLKTSMNEAGEFKILVQKEVEMLKQVSAPEGQAFLDQVLEDRPVVVAPSAQTLESARNEVRAAPLDKLRLQKLLDVEKQAKNFAMVQYLEGRIRQTEEKGAL